MSDFTPARVKRLRKTMGLTQEKFAPYVKKHFLTISRWERGQVEVPELEAETMRRLETEQERKGQRRASRAARGTGK